MLSLKKTGWSLLILLAAAGGIGAQTPHPVPFPNVGDAYTHLKKFIYPAEEINHLRADPALYCMTDPQESTINVGVLVTNGSHYKYYQKQQQDSGYVKFDNRDTWVFILNELTQRWPHFTNPDTILKCKRLAQILGLPDTADRDTIVILSVKKSNLFRPAYQTNNATRVVQRPDRKYTIPPSQALDTARFFHEQLVGNTMPWTRMGYTYNWGSTDSTNYIGLTEFVFLRGTKVQYQGHMLTKTLGDQNP